jgi:hypothetical protein
MPRISVKLLLLSACVSISFSFQVIAKEKNRLKISYYNLDALYDTLPNQGIRDSAFTPNATIQWNTSKYNEKISNHAQVIRSLHDSTSADILGLSGVETERVLKDLLAIPALAQLNYAYVWPKGEKGEKGLACVLLYNPKKVKILWDSAIAISNKTPHLYRYTADALHVKVRSQKQIIELIVVSLPNPLEDKRQQIPGIQLNAAQQLLSYIVSKDLHNHPAFILLGSMHASPTDPMLKLLYNAKMPPLFSFKQGRFVNLMSNLDTLTTGTYFVETQPYITDYGLISNLLFQNHSGWQYKTNSIKVHNPTWMQHPYQRYAGHPYHHYFNGKWIGGFGDYFPVSYELEYAKKRKKVNQ